MPKKRLPPYGREAAELAPQLLAQRRAAFPHLSDAEQRDSVDLRVFSGQYAWHIAKHADTARYARIVLPPGEDVAAFDLSMVRGLSPWLIWIGDSEPDGALADRIIDHLLAAGAMLVRHSVWGGDWPPMIVDKRAVCDNAA